jgi:hypothetical protein
MIQKFCLSSKFLAPWLSNRMVDFYFDLIYSNKRVEDSSKVKALVIGEEQLPGQLYSVLVSRSACCSGKGSHSVGSMRVSIWSLGLVAQQSGHRHTWGQTHLKAICLFQTH